MPPVAHGSNPERIKMISTIFIIICGGLLLVGQASPLAGAGLALPYHFWVELQVPSGLKPQASRLLSVLQQEPGYSTLSRGERPLARTLHPSPGGKHSVKPGSKGQFPSCTQRVDATPKRGHIVHSGIPFYTTENPEKTTRGVVVPAHNRYKHASCVYI